jgi:glycosyltransferase involved in cell wall biosynthesis
MRRIAIITNLYPPFEKGGAEQIAKRQAEFLSKENKVVVITSHPKGKYEEINVNANLKIIYLNIKNIFPYYDIAKHNFFKRMIWRWKDMHNDDSALRIAKILKHEMIEIAFLHNLTGLGYQIPKMIKELNIKQVLTLHDVQLIHPSGQLRELRKLNLLEKYYTIKTKEFFKYCDLVLSPSKFLANYYLKYGFWDKEKIQIITNPVDGDYFFENKKSLRDKIRLLYVGQINTAKGVQFITEILKKSEHFVLELAGNGILKKYLEELSKKHKNIIYHGKVSQEELKKLYDKANFVIMPSMIQENLPTVILEAGARSVPVISSRVGGAMELIDDGINGYLFPANNKKVFTSILAEILRLSEDDYHQMQEAMWKKAQSWRGEKYFERLGEIL